MTTYDTEFFAGRSETVTRSASVVAPVVKELVCPRSVLDLGCGQGEWLAAFGLDDWFGVDIAAPEGEGYHRANLEHVVDLGRTFDLVLCLEVGEHLQPAAADVLVDSVCRHGATVLWSAAVLGQEGKGHVNLQPHEFWHGKFEARGYVVNDSIRPRIQDHRVSPWYRHNTFLYLRDR